MGWVLTDEDGFVGVESRSFNRMFLNDAKTNDMSLVDSKTFWSINLSPDGVSFESKTHPGRFIGKVPDHPYVTLTTEATFWKLTAPIHPLPYKPILSLKLDSILGKTVGLSFDL